MNSLSCPSVYFNIYPLNEVNMILSSTSMGENKLLLTSNIFSELANEYINFYYFLKKIVDFIFQTFNK